MFIFYMQDIKSPNVLLGADYTAKIADVGLAKLQNQTYLSVNQEAIGGLLATRWN